MSVIKLQFLLYARYKNGHLQKVNSHFSIFASLELELLFSDIHFSINYLIKNHEDTSISSMNTDIELVEMQK